MIQFGGSLNSLSGPKEQWACGVRVYTGDPAGDYLQNPQAYADALGPKLATWFGTAANGFPSAAALEFVKVNNIDGAGHYVDGKTHQAALNASGAANPIQLSPAFTCVAITWETGITRGHASRGRIYPPNYIYAPVGSQISATDVTKVVNCGKALLGIINSTLDGTTLVRPVVVSSIGAGAIREITGVSVDNVYDVQRRRKNRLAATRTTAVWP